MSPIKSLHSLLFLGNILGVHRTNFWSNKNKKTFLIVSQIIILIIFHTAMIFGGIYILFEKGETQLQSIYGFFTGIAYLNYLSSVICGMCYNRSFESYLQSINLVYEYYKDDNKLKKYLKKIYWFCIFYSIFAISFTIFRTVEIMLQFASVNLYIMAFVSFSHFMIRATIVLQHFLLFVVIIIVVSLVQCVSSSVLATQQRVSRSVGMGQECDITEEQIQDWVEKYQVLVNACEKVAQCFGRTFIVALGLTVTHYIFLAYYLCYIIILKVDTTEFKKVSFVIFGYVTLLLLPIVAGQVLRNQAVRLHRTLVRLYNTIIIGSREAEAKSIKQFIRLSKKKPLEIKFSSKVPAGLYMIPVILSFSISNVIVLLQFNHIV